MKKNLLHFLSLLLVMLTGATLTGQGRLIQSSANDSR